MKRPHDSHGGADAYGNADGTGGSQASEIDDDTDGDRESLLFWAVLMAIGIYLFGIGLSWLLEYVRLLCVWLMPPP